jgi:hypothetical protein
MLLILFVIQSFNPSLSLGILLPDNDTEKRFDYFYHLELENSFTKKLIAPGIFINFFYKDEYMHYYSTNSGLPLTLRAGGGGLQLKVNATQNIEFAFNLGYYFGEFLFPVVQDSGIVTRESKWRKSLGTSAAVNLLNNIGRFRIGLKLYVNLIPFGAQKEDPWSENQPPYLNYASLSSLGLGVIVGLNKEEK